MIIVYHEFLIIPQDPTKKTTRMPNSIESCCRKLVLPPGIKNR